MNYLTTDTDLTAVADAIRVKVGVQGALMYPDDYIDFIDELVKPTGTKTITENGTGIDVASYSKVDVNVSGGGGGGSGIYFSYGAADWNDNKPTCSISGMNPATRKSIWKEDGQTAVYFFSGSAFLSPLHLIPIPTGATTVTITIDKSIQFAVREYIGTEDNITSSVSTTGWTNITANTGATVTLTTGTSFLSASFRVNSSSPSFTNSTNPLAISVEFA